MHRLALGIGLGIVFGVIDVWMSLPGNHPDRGTAMLAQAFTSRFAIGVLGANVSLRVHPILAGAVVGLLVSLPDLHRGHRLAPNIRSRGRMGDGAVGKIA